jgi:hypothetical protein
LYDQVPFSYFLTLTAPPGRLKEYLDAWSPRWEELGDPRQQPVWVMVVSNHNDPHEDPWKGHIHLHAVVGEISYADLFASLMHWNGGRHIERIYNRWGILHYLFAQTKNKIAHALDTESYCHPLLAPPISSDNLELFEARILQERADARKKAATRAVRVRCDRERLRDRDAQR